MTILCTWRRLPVLSASPRLSSHFPAS